MQEKWRGASILALLCARWDRLFADVRAFLTWVDDFLSCRFEEANFLFPVKRLVQSKGSKVIPSKKPVVSGELPFSGLMSYSTNEMDAFRRAATYVDKILKGAKVADLPVEQTTRYEMVINLKTASQIGLTIPTNVLARADRIIK